MPISTGTGALGFCPPITKADGVRHEGEWTVPEVVHGAWIDDETGSVGLFFLNVRGDGAVAIDVDVDVGRRWGVTAAGVPVVRKQRDGTEVVGAVTAGNRLAMTVDLTPRVATMVEISPRSS